MNGIDALHTVHVVDGGTFEAYFNSTPGVGETFSTLEAGVAASVFLVVAVHHYATTDPRHLVPAATIHVTPAAS